MHMCGCFVVVTKDVTDALSSQQQQQQQQQQPQQQQLNYSPAAAASLEEATLFTFGPPRVRCVFCCHWEMATPTSMEDCPFGHQRHLFGMGSILRWMLLEGSIISS
jgi:hypothetical protein